MGSKDSEENFTEKSEEVIKRRKIKIIAKKEESITSEDTVTTSKDEASLSESKPKTKKKATKKKKASTSQGKPEKATKKKKSSNKDEAYKEQRNALYTYFYYANKPVIMTELNLLFKDTPKKTLEAICDDLEAKKLITIKLNGKTKVYFLNQENMPYTDTNGEVSQKENMQMTCSVDVKNKHRKTFEEIEKENTEITAELERVMENNKKLKEEAHALGTALSDEQLREKIKEFKVFLDENKEFKDIEVADKKEFDSLATKEQKFKKLFTERKKLFKNITETVSEGMNKKVKDFLEDVGIEYDH